MKINITKVYVIDKPYEQLFTHLDNIVSTPYNDPKYITFGNLVSNDPLEFIFMFKTPSFGRPFLAETQSTKIFVTIYKLDAKSKVIITTKTNPSILILFFILISLILFKMFTEFNYEGIKISIVFLIMLVLIIVVDKILKERLITSFENDLDITTE